MSYYGAYLHDVVTVECASGSVFTGDVTSFGSSVQALEEYGIEEDFIVVDTGGTSYALFDSEIRSITVLQKAGD